MDSPDSTNAAPLVPATGMRWACPTTTSSPPPSLFVRMTEHGRASTPSLIDSSLNVFGEKEEFNLSYNTRERKGMGLMFKYDIQCNL